MQPLQSLPSSRLKISKRYADHSYCVREQSIKVWVEFRSYACELSIILKLISLMLFGSQFHLGWSQGTQKIFCMICRSKSKLLWCVLLQTIALSALWGNTERRSCRLTASPWLPVIDFNIGIVTLFASRDCRSCWAWYIHQDWCPGRFRGLNEGLIDSF